MANKKHANVVEMARNLGYDQAFTNDLAAHLNHRRLVHTLTAMRAAKGLTQQDIAAKIGCTQGRISKMETSEDAGLSFGAITEYARAIGLRVEITLTGEGATAIDRIRHHASCIKRLTDDLAHLALTDETIAEGVSRFDEAASNLLRMLQDSAKTLPPLADEFTPVAIVETRGVDDSEETQPGKGKPSKRRDQPVLTKA